MAASADRRRFNGPESSRPLLKAPREPEAPVASTSQRKDGRAPDDIRPIFLQPGLIGQASGSAYVEAGKTKMVCAVYGPHPTRRDAPFSAKARLNVEVRFAPFACRGRRKTPGKDAESPYLAAQLHQALLPAIRLDLMPKSAIDVFVTIIECDGPEHDISLATTAASVALCEAGVEMYGLVIGCCGGITPDGSLWLDPADDDLETCSGGLLAAAHVPALGTATSVAFEGDLDRAQLAKAMASLADMCEQVHDVARLALLESAARKAGAAADAVG